MRDKANNKLSQLKIKRRLKRAVTTVMEPLIVLMSVIAKTN